MKHKSDLFLYWAAIVYVVFAGWGLFVTGMNFQAWMGATILYMFGGAVLWLCVGIVFDEW